MVLRKLDDGLHHYKGLFFYLCICLYDGLLIDSLLIFFLQSLLKCLIGPHDIYLLASLYNDRLFLGFPFPPAVLPISIQNCESKQIIKVVNPKLT